MRSILGKKLGMTSLFDEKGKAIPCTVIEAEPNHVAQVKTLENDGYAAYQLAYNEKSSKRTNKATEGHFKKAGIKPTYRLKEVKNIKDELKVGDAIKVDTFKVGDIVDVVGVSKGKGFQGVVRRHHFGGGSRTHGQSDRLRAPGSVGGSSFPSRTFKGMRMAGRMGGDQVTAKRLEIVKIVPDSNLIVVKGAIPGTKNSYVEVRTTKK
jgi:large subunit ribosomal protein L3